MSPLFSSTGTSVRFPPDWDIQAGGLTSSQIGHWNIGLAAENTPAIGTAHLAVCYSASMPRFFFHVHDDLVAHDEEGLELPDLEAAQSVAIRGARDIACEQLREGKVRLSHHIEVTDDAHRTVLTVPFGDAFQVEN